MRIESRNLLLFLTMVFVVLLNLLLPGETYYQSRALGQLLACAALALSMLGWWPGRSPARQGSGNALLRQTSTALILFPLLFLPSVAASRCPGRSLECLALQLSYLALFITLCRLPLKRQWIRGFLCAVALVVTGLMLYALYQHFVGFERLMAALENDPTLAGARGEAMIKRLETGRVYSSFPLPTTFAELIVLTVPLILWRLGTGISSRRVLAVIGWSAVTLLTAVVLVLTGSYGSLPVLGILALLFIALNFRRWPPRIRAALAGALLFLMITAFVLVFAVRGFTPWDALEPHNPVSQRLYNWRAAWAMWQDHPLAGVGPGNFAVAYTQYRLPGANETRLAHNSYLHLAAEGGTLPALALFILILLFCRRGLGRLFGERGAAPGRSWAASFYAALALILYGGFEITVEYPGIGFLGVALCALASRPLLSGGRDPVEPPAGSPAPWKTAGLVALPGLLLLLAGFVWTGSWYAGRIDLDRAEQLLTEPSPAGRAEALILARRAARWNPLDPEAPAIQGRIFAGEGTALFSAELPRAREAYRQASRLDPDRAVFHYRLSELHARSGNPLEARLAADRAARLYPLSSRYRQWRDGLGQAVEGGR